MSDTPKDYGKLKKFVEAALTNPLHPVYRMGMTHSPILQHYAVNVVMLHAVEAEQWFKDYPEKTARLEQVMALCEAEQAALATELGEAAPAAAKPEEDEAEAAEDDEPAAAKPKKDAADDEDDESDESEE